MTKIQSDKVWVEDLDVKNLIYEYLTLLEIETCPNAKVNVLNRLAKCFIEIKEYDKAILYLNRSLDINSDNNKTALELRNECYKYMGDEEKLVKGILVFSDQNYINKNRDYIQQLTASAMEKRTRKFIDKHGLHVSNSYYHIFFCCFVGILPKKVNLISKMIIEQDYTSLDKALMSPDWETKYENCNEGLFTLRSIRAGIFFLKRMFNNALNEINNPKTTLESLLKEYLIHFTRNSRINISQFNTKEIESSNNPTLIFFLARFYYFDGNEKEYFRLLDLIKEYEFVYFDLLTHYRKENNLKQFKICSDEAISKFGHKLLLVQISAEYALEAKDDDFFIEIFPYLEKNNAENLLIVSNRAFANNSVDVGFEMLNKAIKIDPNCFKALYKKAEMLSSINIEESRTYFKKAQRCASSYDEVFLTSFQIFNLECIMELRRNLGI